MDTRKTKLVYDEDSGVKKSRLNSIYDEIFTSFNDSLGKILYWMEDNYTCIDIHTMVKEKVITFPQNKEEFAYLINSSLFQFRPNNPILFGLKDLILLLSLTIHFGDNLEAEHGAESFEIFTHCVNMVSRAHFYLSSLDTSNKKFLTVEN